MNKQVTIVHNLSNEVTNIENVTTSLEYALQEANYANDHLAVLENLLWLQNATNILGNQLHILDVGLQKMNISGSQNYFHKCLRPHGSRTRRKWIVVTA